MSTLVWDRVGKRRFENGADKAVLYLPSGIGVAWSGLTSVVEKTNMQTEPVYYDGKKINEIVTLGGFSASLSAFTYPDEFEEIQGSAKVIDGVHVGDQPPQFFALCYRTYVGNDVGGSNANYKLHIIYNVLAVPSDISHVTQSDSPALMEMGWDLNAVPEDIPGFRPTAKITIETEKLDPWLIEDIEAKLYGSPGESATLMPMADLVTWLREWARVRILDNGDGTWTAAPSRPGIVHIFDNDSGIFELIGVDAYFTDESETEFVITDTRRIPPIRIVENKDGTWIASANDPGAISVDPETGIFEIRNATLTLSGPDMYRITDTD